MGPQAGPFRAFAYRRSSGEMTSLPRVAAVSVCERRRGGSVKVRRTTQGKLEREGSGSQRSVGVWVSVWPAMGVRSL